MHASDLIALAERCEQATVPDRELDEHITDALFERSHFAQLKDAPLGTGCMMWWQDGHQQSALRYTASLDAAMTLVPEGLRVELFITEDGRAAARTLRPGEGGVPAFGELHATPALALCAASFRAQAGAQS